MASAPRSARILVVDDDPMMLELLTTRLDLAGYEAHGARDGRQGLARLRDLRPAAMVLDINMPEMSGFDVLQRLRETGQISALPVMVLTARHETSDVQTAIELGARDYLSKPFNDQQFLLRIKRLLRTVRPVSAPNDDELLL
jgi:two-component system OmpR family response regulator